MAELIQGDRSSTRRLTLLYIASLSTIACLLLLGQMVVQKMLGQQERNLQIVSAASRQQILCQRMGKVAQSLRLTEKPSERQQYVQELQTIVQEWQLSGQTLHQRMGELSDLGLMDNELHQRLTRVQPAARTLTTAVQTLITQEQQGQGPTRLRLSPEAPAIQLLGAGRDFTRGMDEILQYYNQKARTGVARLQQVEAGLLGLSLLVLALEGLLIFRPAVAKIRQTLAALAISLKQTQQTAYQLETEQKKSEKLLLNILPEPIAVRLKEEEGAIADGFAEATVLFADIVGFTQLADRLPPQELVVLLNRIFSQFDQLLEQHHLEKIKTIGDAYMVVGGLPQPNPDHAAAVADMALDMQRAIDEFNQVTGESFKMRIGIHTGPVVAGVIGLKKFIYDLWGDTVNIASRMESHGLPGEIQVTEVTYECLKDRYDFKPRGIIPIKGKGEMSVYLLLEKR